MSAPNKCPHCGSPAKPNEDGQFDGEYECGRIEASYGDPEFRSLLCRNRELAATKRELSNATDTLDLMRDEFQRIVARMVEDGMIIKDVGQEILGICNRARSQIAQRVPVIAQRDAAERRVQELEGLRVLSRDIGTITLLLDQDLSTVPPLTLGEAMPRKEGE